MDTRLSIYTLASTPNAMKSSMDARVEFGLVKTVGRNLLSDHDQLVTG